MQHAIQIDMFDVQLGSALLLQFRLESGVVSVLADAGVKASGYAPDHVHRKLLQLFAKENDKSPRVDLMIGTHYDADHLDGLVPILEDLAIEVGQLWLPPVVNDAAGYAVDSALDDYQFLATQFADEDHLEILQQYIDAKIDEVREIDEICGEIDWEAARRPQQHDDLDDQRTERERDISKFGHERATTIHGLRTRLADLVAYLGDEEPHGAAPVDAHETEGRADRFRDFFRDGPFLELRRADRSSRIAMARHYLTNAPAARDARQKTLLHIQKAAVKDAINAASLHNVVRAAKARSLTAETQIIRDGTPRRFVWKATEQKFVGTRQDQSADLVLTLLGPSQSLVAKHRHRLPRGTYLARSLAYSGEIKSITPSNQLSYVARIEHRQQGILISGDAGFVDFKQGRSSYFPALLKSLMPLHVVQVAHHGGNNAHFYRVLEDAGMAEQKDYSYFLLSHATADRYRPSMEFRRFIEGLRKEDDDFRLLFTAKPRRDKIAGIEGVVEPPTISPDRDRGDVRLVYGNGGWTVVDHAISV